MKIVFPCGRTNHFRYLAPLIGISEANGNKNVLVIFTGENKSKSYLDWEPSKLQAVRLQFPKLEIVEISSGDESPNLAAHVPPNVTYVSVDSPTKFVSRFSPPVGPWIQVQTGADILPLVAAASVRPDAIALWGSNWVSESFQKHHYLTKRLQEAAQFVAASPSAVLGHVGLRADDPHTSKPSPSLSCLKSAIFFEPTVALKSRSNIITAIRSFQFTSKNRQGLRSFKGLIRGAIDQLEIMGYAVYLRGREKAARFDLGYSGLELAPTRPDLWGDPSSQLIASEVSVAMFPSHSIPESLRLNRKVLSLDPGRLYSANTRAYPQFIMLEDLLNSCPEDFIHVKRVEELEEGSARLSSPISGELSTRISGWIDDGVGREEKFLKLLANANRSRHL